MWKETARGQRSRPKRDACNPQSAGANADALREAGTAQIIGVDNRENWIACEQVEGDLYRILEGKPQAVRRYAVEYLRRFLRAEEMSVHLARMTGWYSRADAQGGQARTLLMLSR